jgi:hypothetical protein
LKLDGKGKLMSEQGYGVVLFPSVSHCMRAESLLQAAGLACKLIPVPRELSSDCGVALRFAWPDRGKVRTVLEAAGLDAEGIYPLHAA